MSNPVSILGADLTGPGGRQTLQDALDVLYGLIQKAGGVGAGPSTFDELRVRKLTVTDTIDVVPQDKPPANGFANQIVPWLTGQRGRSFVMRYDDQNDGGDRLEWRYQPYPLTTATATTGDWELAAYSAQRDPAGGYRRVGSIRFGSDGSIRTYTASEVLVFDSSASSGFTLANKGELHGHDGATDAAIAPGADNEIPVYDSTANEGITPRTIADVLTAAGIDFTTGATTGRAPVTQEYSSRPGTATASYTPVEELPAGGSWRVTVIGDATGGTAFIKYDGNTLTDNTGTNPICMSAVISRKSSTEVNCAGWFASDGGTTLETDELTSTTLLGTISVSAGTGGTITSFIVERVGDTASGTAGGSGGIDTTSLYIPVPSFHYDAQYATGFAFSSGALVSRWDDTAGSLLHSAQATTTNQPTLVGSGTTSAVDFDGTDNYTVFAGTLTGLTSTSGDLWAVFELDGLGVDGTIFAVGNSGSSTQYFGLRVNASNKLEVFENNSGTVDIANGSTTLTTGQVYVVRVTSDASTWKVYLNGVLETLTVTSGANNGDWWGDVGTRNRLALGALVRSTVANYFNGKIYEVFGWDSSGKLITDRMAAQILAVTRRYWGLS